MKARTSNRRLADKGEVQTICLGEILTNEQMEFVVKVIGNPELLPRSMKRVLCLYFAAIENYLASMGVPHGYMVDWIVDNREEIMARVARRN